jgi:hypothetical protein
MFTEKRHHLIHPVPYSLKIHPIGKTLTELEWHKFCKRLISPKLAQDCHRQRDGNIYFIGEGGLAAAEIFQHKFNSRFRMRLICDSKASASSALQLADNEGLKIEEVFFKNTLGEHVKLNNEAVIQREFSVH